MAAKSEANGPSFDESRVDRLTAATAGTRFGSVDWVPSTGSTNADLAAAAVEGADECVLVADLQTAGRGRRDRTWTAPAESGVLLSMLIRDQRARAPFWIVGAVALAASDAAGEQTDPSVDVTLKWPNDLLIDGAKVAGILAAVAGDAVIVGIGLNAIWGPERPQHVPHNATALSRHSSQPVDREALAAAIVCGSDRWLSADADDLHRAWRARCATIGASVVVERADGALRGVAVDVGRDGALFVEGADGTVERVVVGDVEHARIDRDAPVGSTPRRPHDPVPTEEPFGRGASGGTHEADSVCRHD